MSGSFNLVMGSAALSGVVLALYVSGGKTRAAATEIAQYNNRPKSNNFNLQIQK